MFGVKAEPKESEAQYTVYVSLVVRSNFGDSLNVSNEYRIGRKVTLEELGGILKDIAGVLGK